MSSRISTLLTGRSVSRIADFGAGEILLTFVEQEGTRNGYDVSTVRRVSIALIAAGGAGSLQRDYFPLQ
jgi:cyclase